MLSSVGKNVTTCTIENTYQQGKEHRHNKHNNNNNNNNNNTHVFFYVFNDVKTLYIFFRNNCVSNGWVNDLLSINCSA